MKKLHPILSLFLIVSFVLTACGTPSTPVGVDTPAEQVVETSEPISEEKVSEDMPIYQDPTADIDDRVEDLLERMTLEEKIGQMTQVEKNSIKDEDISARFIGSILSGGGGSPTPNTAENWAEMVNAFQERALATRLGIPLIYGVDAVHGHGNLEGATVFPHNVGLGATRDADLLTHIGRATAVETAATGIYWNFGPVVAVPQDIRWGRAYEAYGENTALVSELAAAYVQGLQSVDGVTDLGNRATILATAKHFVGDGGTVWGTSTTEIMQPYQLDQGDMQVDESVLRAVHLPPYQAAIDAGAMSVMVSFSSWNGLKMHANQYLITDVLKGELGFEGFVVSDWGGIDQIADNYYDAVVTAINAGIDMNMVPTQYDQFIYALSKAVENGDVPMERIDNAVRRILRVKFQLGLFEHPFADETLLEYVGSAEHRDLAREAVSASLVLLKNDNQALPISKDAATIFVAGYAGDDVGLQCGGWTIEWQGASGHITPGTTILDGIEATVSEDPFVQFNRFGKFERVTDENGDPLVADVGIAVVGEDPYAEGVGDRADLSLSETDLNVIERTRDQSEILVIILISGRPMIITEQLSQADAFIAAWLPGTEGQGVSDALFGDMPFTGKLPYTWPRWMSQIPFDFANLPAEGCDAPLFPYGYGLTLEDDKALEILDCSKP